MVVAEAKVVLGHRPRIPTHHQVVSMAGLELTEVAEMKVAQQAPAATRPELDIQDISESVPTSMEDRAKDSAGSCIERDIARMDSLALETIGRLEEYRDPRHSQKAASSLSGSPRSAGAQRRTDKG